MTVSPERTADEPNKRAGYSMVEGVVAGRFWERVDKSAGPEGCWPWTGYRDKKGYGKFSVKGRGLPAHRLAWELAHGRAMPRHLYGCHACDNPSCVNPSHIWPGTCRQNAQDMIAKGRGGGAVQVNREKTHCAHGHALTGANVKIVTRHGITNRVCRECQRKFDRECKRRHYVPAAERKEGREYAW